MDAMAVSAARGLAAERIRVRDVLAVALAFGGFQALMPAIGWAMGAELGPRVQAWDHWIAFGLLAGIGGKMIWEAARQPDGDPADRGQLFGLGAMVVLGIATSIDALAAGVTMPMLHAPLALSIVTIGAVTAVLSTVGLLAGRRFGQLLGRRLDVVGGVVLIGIGTKILAQHLIA
jgi:putative Mn2+ efflux pump MntP